MPKSPNNTQREDAKEQATNALWVAYRARYGALDIFLERVELRGDGVVGTVYFRIGSKSQLYKALSDGQLYLMASGGDAILLP